MKRKVAHRYVSLIFLFVVIQLVYSKSVWKLGQNGRIARLAKFNAGLSVRGGDLEEIAFQSDFSVGKDRELFHASLDLKWIYDQLTDKSRWILAFQKFMAKLQRLNGVTETSNQFKQISLDIYLALFDLNPDVSLRFFQSSLKEAEDLAIKKNRLIVFYIENLLPGLKTTTLDHSADSADFESAQSSEVEVLHEKDEIAFQSLERRSKKNIKNIKNAEYTADKNAVTTSVVATTTTISSAQTTISELEKYLQSERTTELFRKALADNNLGDYCNEKVIFIASDKSHPYAEKIIKQLYQQKCKTRREKGDSDRTEIENSAKNSNENGNGDSSSSSISTTIISRKIKKTKLSQKSRDAILSSIQSLNVQNMVNKIYDNAISTCNSINNHYNKNNKLQEYGRHDYPILVVLAPPAIVSTNTNTSIPPLQRKWNKLIDFVARKGSNLVFEPVTYYRLPTASSNTDITDNMLNFLNQAEAYYSTRLSEYKEFLLSEERLLTKRLQEVEEDEILPLSDE